jgi:aminoglycoside phosphotransferase (APT) family kinase protein
VTLSPTVLTERLRPAIRQQLGERVDVAHLATMEDGHAGLTFGFDTVDEQGTVIGSYVLKLAPPGVTRRGNTDVYRQGRLLRALHAAGLKVPAVPWASPDDEPLGTPYIVMERLPGRVFVIWEPHASFSRDPGAVNRLWIQAAQSLAEIHRVQWTEVLSDWEAPRPLLEEVQRWSPVLRHATDPAWLEAGRAVEAGLLRSLPPDEPIGLVHGDYQPGNLLYQDGEVVGIIDWELSSIGAQGLDVGWLLMMSDAECWDWSWKPLTTLSGSELLAAYRQAAGPVLAHAEWFEALAAYRMGAIACLNVKLHRTGKRPDELWEKFAPSISHLFARASQLLQG